MSISPVKLIMTYDIICPQSWVAYQVLQKKLLKWRTYRPVNVDYKPAIHPLIHKMTYGVLPSGLITPKKDYMLNDLGRICDFYDIKRYPFDINFSHMENRSLSSLLLLMKIKNKLPEFYEKMMIAMWTEFWYKSGKVNRATVFLRLGRELGIPFKVMDNLVMHIESREIYVELIDYTKFLIEEERILSCPWFILWDKNDRKVVSFGDILRFEMLDEILMMNSENFAKVYSD